MVCNDVKYCPEKDADSYYGRAGSEPFNLKPPDSAPAGENADPSVSLPICYGRERVFLCALFSSLLSRFPSSNIIASCHGNSNFHTWFFSLLPYVTQIVNMWKVGDMNVISAKTSERNITEDQSIKFRPLFSYSFLFFYINIQKIFYILIF